MNLRGLVLVTRAAIPHLRQSRGLVVNLSSIAGTVPTPGLSIYGASKAAVISFTRSLNEELDADGVRATALCPAFVDTDMAAWSGIPGEEMIQPEDCAEIVRLLLRLTPRARIPQVVIERVGSTSPRAAAPNGGLELRGRYRALEARLDPAVAADEEHPRLGGQLPLLHPAVRLRRLVVLVDLDVDEPHRARPEPLAHVVDDVHDGAAGAARAELRRGEGEHERRAIGERVGSPSRGAARRRAASAS